jgi:hypothetical protein
MLKTLPSGWIGFRTRLPTRPPNAIVLVGGGPEESARGLSLPSHLRSRKRADALAGLYVGDGGRDIGKHVLKIEEALNSEGSLAVGCDADCDEKREGGDVVQPAGLARPGGDVRHENRCTRRVHERRLMEIDPA